MNRPSSREVRHAARNLAAKLTAQPWTPDGHATAVREALPGIGNRACRTLAARLVQRFGAVVPAHQTLVAFLADQTIVLRTVAHIKRVGSALPITLDPPRFAPAPRFVNLEIPKLATPGEIADWLDISLPQLDWFADTFQTAADTPIPILQHYVRTVHRKRNGDARLIESPKSRLMAMQRRILHEILNHVPTHEAAHGFVPGRSAVTGAAKHAGERVVVTADIRGFFLETPVARIRALFQRLGYPSAAARTLTGLCTTATPIAFLAQHRAGHVGALPRTGFSFEIRQRLRAPHLPQGAPTSPALANLTSFRLDTRLSGLANAFGATYTRYADDLAFSGDLPGNAPQDLLRTVADIVRDEGYVLHPAKSRTMCQATTQRVTGIVVNQHLNVSRVEFDRLKAILTNCRRHGPSGQNREGHPEFRAHLEGRIGWVAQLNPAKAARLYAIFDAIDWAGTTRR